MSGEETYRVLIDEIPDRKNLQAGTLRSRSVKACRCSLPGSTRVQAPHLEGRGAKGKLVLEATNSGQKRVKLTKLTVTDEKNRDLVKNGGLAYVLGGQTKTWELAGRGRRQDASPSKRKAIRGRSMRPSIAGKGG